MSTECGGSLQRCSAVCNRIRCVCPKRDAEMSDAFHAAAPCRPAWPSAAQLCDFGLSQVLAGTASEVASTQGAGHAFWMAPELLRGQPYDYKVCGRVGAGRDEACFVGARRVVSGGVVPGRGGSGRGDPHWVAFRAGAPGHGLTQVAGCCGSGAAADGC